MLTRKDCVLVMAGACGGTLGALAMVGWQWVFRYPLRRWTTKAPEADSGLGFQTYIRKEEPSVEVARVLLAGTPAGQRRVLGATLVHMAFGACAGAAYACTLHRIALVRRLWGWPFAVVLWIGAAEVGLPITGLSRWPWRSSLGIQAFGLTAHLLYAMPLEWCCRLAGKAGEDE